MGEFLDRLRMAFELDGEARGDGSDPLGRHMKILEKQMREWSRKKS